MVYNLLLRGPQEVFVASGQFKRKSISRVGKSAPSSASFTCRGCGLAIGGSRSVFYRHRLFYCNKSRYNNAWSLTELDRNEYEGSGLSPAILRTCRLVHLEAVPILYRTNSFRFEDAAAARQFRWQTDMQQAGYVQKIHIMLPYGCSEMTDPTAHGKRSNLHPWLNYLTNGRQGLPNDFPNLKGITLTFGRRLAISDAKTVRNHFDTFMRYMYRLDWIQFIGLNDVRLITHLKPVLERSNGSNGEETIQAKFSDYEEHFIGWTNVSLWWGSPGSEPPCNIPAFAGYHGERWRLYPMEDGEDVTYTAGSSYACWPNLTR